jgi:hypothetical protein
MFHIRAAYFKNERDKNFVRLRQVSHTGTTTRETSRNHSPGASVCLMESLFKHLYYKVCGPNVEHS